MKGYLTQLSACFSGNPQKLQESKGAMKMRERKMQDWKMRTKCDKNSGVENARPKKVELKMQGWKIRHQNAVGWKMQD